MRRLSPRVNVIPVIGKADSLTPNELRGFRKRVFFFLLQYADGYLIIRLDHGRYRTLRHPCLQLPL
jgi:Septin